MLFRDRCQAWISDLPILNQNHTNYQPICQVIEGRMSRWVRNLICTRNLNDADYLSCRSVCCITRTSRNYHTWVMRSLPIILMIECRSSYHALVMVLYCPTSPCANCGPCDYKRVLCAGLGHTLPLRWIQTLVLARFVFTRMFVNFFGDWRTMHLIRAPFWSSLYAT